MNSTTESYVCLFIIFCLLYINYKYKKSFFLQIVKIFFKSVQPLFIIFFLVSSDRVFPRINHIRIFHGHNLSFTNKVKWKGIKKGIKICPTLYGWEGVCLSVCLSVCTSKKLNNFWWNDSSWPVQLRTINFGEGVSDQLASRGQPWLKTACF